MNKSEYRIDAKIIKELSLFLMLHNVKDFELSFHSNQESVHFIIKSKMFPKEVLQRMKEKLSRKREIAIEVYGWELLGDTDSRNELDILGSLIDDIQVSKEDEWDILTLKRNYKYKK
jgi:hypothetical protein